MNAEPIPKTKHMNAPANKKPKRKQYDTSAEARPPQDFRAGLKIKIKNLADEARTIRHMENTTENWFVKLRVQNHRRTVVRVVAREAQLAYAFIRGRDYKATERGLRACTASPNLREIARLVVKYGTWGRNTAVLDRVTVEVGKWMRG